MELKINWIYFLILGGNLLLSGCRKVDYFYSDTYVYENKSSYAADIKAYSIHGNDDGSPLLIKSCSIPANGSAEYTIEGEGGTAPFHFGNMKNEYADSVVIIFSDMRILNYSNRDGILNPDNYTMIEKEKRKRRFIFTFY